ncbi:hypothetical protein [Adhaeribacter pallidiroseus]|uniref:Uncharacterized protein n=1 Tax=Adhaeribacter pallidiroseus TaxID=2072847 RepID=A0A369QGU4_9BACT|nr:hypothetical protein [Adhaeribacter pallidiroseus]RDC62487.1 hypothetical protein AHMF7616_01081 [Adhaeribacter pallidiroseus]
MRKIYLLAVLVTLWGCSPEKEKSNQQANDIEVKALNDSTVIVKDKDRIDTVIIDLGPDFAFDWKDANEFTKSFSDFYKNNKTNPGSGNQIRKIDVTGDGMEDEVSSSLKQFDDSLIYLNSIFDNNNKIWTDKLVIDKDYAVAKFGSEKLFELLKPYSCKFLLQGRTDFIRDYEYNSTIKALQPSFLKNINPADTIFWKEELKVYKGKIVDNVYLESGAASFLWDKRNKKLIEIYSE